MKKLTIGLAVIALLAAASGAAAQEEWDDPSFMAPQPGNDLGFYFVDEGGVGFEGIWRQTRDVNLGLRLGFVDEAGGTLEFGAETWGPIVLADQNEFPLDVTWTAGVGASINGLNTIGVPVGISLGRTFDAGDLTMQVYGHPRLELLAFENPFTDDIDLDLDPRFDVGADLYLSHSVTLKIGASFGQGDALGIGLAWRQ